MNISWGGFRTPPPPVYAFKMAGLAQAFRGASASHKRTGMERIATALRLRIMAWRRLHVFGRVAPRLD